MEKNIKSALGAALVILSLVGAYGIFQYSLAYSQSVQSPRTFSVSGEGKIVGTPDIAQFTFGVITQGGVGIKALQNENSQKGNAIIAFIKSNGVQDKDIQTQSYSIEPRYQNLYCPQSSSACPPPEIIGYTVSQNVLVKIRDFTKISDILSGVAEKGANSVSQLSFSIDEPIALQEKAQEQAIAKAKDAALKLAAAGGFRIGKLVYISQSSYPQPLYQAMQGKGGAVSSSAPVVEPGSETITANVNLTYEIK